MLASARSWVASIFRTDRGACCARGGLLQAEQALQAYREAFGKQADIADGQQDAGHERYPVQGVVPDRERLPRPAEEYLLMRHQTRHAHRMHVELVHRGAARAGYL